MTNRAASAQGTEHSNHGTVTSVRGSVVDVRFDDSLPPIYTRCMPGKDAANLHRGADAARRTSCPRDRAQSHAGARSRHGRGRHRRASQGAGRQMESSRECSTCSAIPSTASRRRPTWNGAPSIAIRRSLASRSTKSEVFETGIKVIDVLVPLERGGKAGLFGGAGRGQDGACSPR